MNHGIGLAAKNLLSLSSAARKTEDAFVDWIWRSSRIWTAFVRPWMINSTFKCSPASELRHSYCVSRMWKLLPKKSFVLLSSRSCEDCDDMIIPEEPARTLTVWWSPMHAERQNERSTAGRNGRPYTPEVERKAVWPFPANGDDLTWASGLRGTCLRLLDNISLSQTLISVTGLMHAWSLMSS